MNELAGRLRERVRIERRGTLVSPTAGLSDEWHLVAERWAEVVPLSGSPLSEVASETWVTSRRWRVTIRPGVPLELPLRIVWRGLIMRIAGLDDSLFRRGIVTMIGEEWGRQ